MKKEEFLKELENKLQILDPNEIKDIIAEYKDHIENKMKDGRSESEAIKDFGDIGILAKEILSAYKINENYSKKSDFDKKLDNFVNKVIDFFKDFAKKLENKESKEILDIIIKIIIVCVIVAIVQIPFQVISSLMINLLRDLPGTGFVIGLWRFLFGILSFVISVIILFYGIKYLLDKELNINGKTIGEHIDDEIKKEKESYEEKQKNKKSTNASSPKKEETKDEVYYEKKTNNYKKDYYYNTENYNKRNNYDDKSALYITFSIILKILAVCLIIPLIASIVGISVTFAFIITLMFKGIFLIDILLILFGLIMIIGSITGMISHLAFKVVK